MIKPSFYCENCGREVSSGLDICPGCGQNFSSVRCPSCGFTGLPELFRKNCPRCGYTGEDTVEKKHTGSLFTVKSGKDTSGINKKLKKQLPVWFYRILIGFLVTIIVILLRTYILL